MAGASKAQGCKSARWGPASEAAAVGPQNPHLGCGFDATQSGFQQHPDSGKIRGWVFSAGWGCHVAWFCVPHQAVAPSFGVFFSCLAKTSPGALYSPRGTVSSSIFRPSFMGTLWVSFSRLSSCCCCHAEGRRKLLSPTPGPYSGASNPPHSRGWEPQCAKNLHDPGVPLLAAAGFCQGEAGSCRVAGIGF